ncbi:hypothetical protein ACFSMW_13585 [Virgibacillus halophilus]
MQKGDGIHERRCNVYFLTFLPIVLYLMVIVFGIYFCGEDNTVYGGKTEYGQGKK